MHVKRIEDADRKLNVSANLLQIKIQQAAYNLRLDLDKRKQHKTINFVIYHCSCVFPRLQLGSMFNDNLLNTHESL